MLKGMQVERWTTRNRSGSVLAFASLALAILGVAPGEASADTRIVNCPGQRIAHALRLATSRSLLVKVRGICNEHVVIDRDDVTLRADSAGAAIQGSDPLKSTILIDGGRGVVIEGLIVSGPRHGIVGTNGSEFTIDNATVENNAQNGIVALFNSTVTVTGSRVRNNGATGDPQLGRSGISITDSSAGTVINSIVTGNTRNGLVISRSSSGRIGRTTSGVEGPNTITGNGSSGIFVYQTSQAMIWGNTINDNTTNGVSVEGSSVTVVKNDISSNDDTGISVTNDGGARIGYDDPVTAPALRRTDCACTNRITGNGGSGIAVSNGGNANFHGNLIELNNGRGVTVSSATGRAAGGNVIRNNGDDGIGVFRGFLFQGAFSTLTPARDVITGNGTAHQPNTDGRGVTATNGAGISLNNFEISGNFRDGVGLYFGASASLRSEDPANVSIITNNGSFAATHGQAVGPAPASSIGSGIDAFDGSTVEARGITISNNKRHGISLSDGAKGAVRSHAITSNTGSVTVVPMTISGNAVNGINVFNGSSVDVSRNTTITNNGTPGSGPGLPAGNGLSLSTNAAASVNDSSITFNKASGVNVFGNSSLSIGGSSPDFPPVGITLLGSSVTDNSLDGISVSGNSMANLFTGQGQLTSSAATVVTRNGRNGLGCFSQSRVSGTLTSITGNNTAPDLAGSVVFSGAILDHNNVLQTGVLRITLLTTGGGTCF